MAFEVKRGGRGQPTVLCVCDGCGRDEVVAAIHGKGGGDGHGQAVAKIQKLGWTYIGKRLRCPACEAKRKVKGMAVNKTDQAVVNGPREPSRKQKRDIMDLLDDVYDVDAGCYCQGDTDETVADILGVMPGWVAAIRDEFFGPSGENQDMEQLMQRIQEMQRRIEAASADLEKSRKLLSEFKAGNAELRAALDKIRKAVGARVMQRAKA